MMHHAASVGLNMNLRKQSHQAMTWALEQRSVKRGTTVRTCMYAIGSVPAFRASGNGRLITDLIWRLKEAA